MSSATKSPKARTRAKRLLKPFKSVDTVPVRVLQLAEGFSTTTDGLLSLHLCDGVMDDNHVPLAEGRPTFRLDLEFDFPDDDDEWRYVDSQSLAKGVALFMRRMQKRLQDTIDDLVKYEPEFAAAWKGGAK